MPSMRCHQCGKVKRCRMFQDSRNEFDQAGKLQIITHLNYLCGPCARELGYTTKEK